MQVSVMDPKKMQVGCVAGLPLEASLKNFMPLALQGRLLVFRRHLHLPNSSTIFNIILVKSFHGTFCKHNLKNRI